MKRRVFVAIDLPAELKEKITETVKQWHWLPIRWLKPENWHITIIPPAYLEDDEVNALAGVLEKHRLGGSFTPRFSRIVLAPPRAPARMIWLEGETPPALNELREKIAAAWVLEPTLPPLASEPRPLKLHVTLARFKPGELRELEEKTHTLGEVDFQFDLSDVAIMESRLKPGGAEYQTIRTFAV